ncbi:PREDICTED: proton-coupled amino acid transporter 4 [Ceratosolen solmsi marchali]|uniref:Proton-coupled amino acid transporter 4 n=1 Tax=Ceratosolen solmsi marchali TaxID=326594 RepID=A0AAJ6YK48_9HYME|nr:PREDICTED: proton-coupled amino acid transporter 4 [Ceratosolen solmsi marchali]
MNRDNIPLLQKSESGLSLFFATLCIVDIFGVFPIIALPKSIVQCGWLGIPLVLIVFGFQIYTAALLGKSWNLAVTLDPCILKKNRYPLSALTELTLGRWTSLFVSILLDLTVFGGGIPNLLVASQNIQLFGLKMSHNEFNLSFCYWLFIIGLLLCPVMWLGSPRNMKLVVILSTLAISITALLIWWCIIADERYINILPIPTTPSWEKFISGYGMLAFQFDVHPTLMTVQVDMNNIKDINKAVIFSFIMSGSLFMITAGLSVWRYGGSITANLFQLLPPGEIIHAAILLASLQLCLSSVIGHSALFQHLEDQLHIKRTFGWKRCAIRSAVVIFGVALGESVPRFDIVMSLIGGTLTGPLIFVLPPLIYLKLKALCIRRLVCLPVPELQLSKWEKCPISAKEIAINPFVYSRSTHFSFCDTEENSYKKYSFPYSGGIDNTRMNPYDNQENSLNVDTYLQRFSIENFKPVRSKGLSILIDQNQSLFNRLRKENVISNIKITKLGKSCTLQKLIDSFGYSIIVSGILITISSTYINVKNTIQFVKFIPPCIINASSYLPISD